MADPEDDDTGGGTTTKTKPGGKKGGARASIQVSDIPVGEEQAAGVLDAASGGRRRGRGDVDDRGLQQRFAKAIRDPNNKIIATRQQPPTLGDGTALGDTYEIPTHEALSESEIKKDISEARGGRKWIIRVYNEDDKILASKSMDVPGAPRLDPMMMDMGGGTEEDPGMGGEQETLTEEEQVEREIAMDPQIIKAQKNLRLKQIQADEEEQDAKLAEIRARRAETERAMKGDAHTNGNGHKTDDDKLMKAIEASTAPLKAANERMERELAEEKRRNAEKDAKADRRAELEAIAAPLKAAQESTQKMLEQFMTKMGQPPAGPTTVELLAKLDAMKAEIKSDTKDQITAAINSVSAAFNSKVDNLQTLLTTMKKGDDPAVTALISLATGGKGGSAEKDPFSSVEKLLTVLSKLQEVKGASETQPPDFPSYLVEKVAETTPEVLNFFKEQRGAIPSKEEIEKMMRGAAMKMYEGLDASMKKELAAIRLNPNAAPAPQAAPAQQQAQQTPAPAAAAPQASAGAPSAAPAPTIADFPAGGKPAASGGAPAAGAPASTGGVLTPDALFKSLSEQDRKVYSKRVNWVLDGLLEEMKLGIRDMQWPAKAHGNLPKPIIDQFVEATTQEAIYDIIKPYAEPAKLDAIWSYVGPTHKQSEWYQEWLAEGINWIKQAEGVELVEPDDGQPPVVED